MNNSLKLDLINMQTTRVLEHIKEGTTVEFIYINKYSRIELVKDNKPRSSCYEKVWKTQEVPMRGIVGFASHPHLWVTLLEGYTVIDNYDFHKDKFIGINRKLVKNLKLNN